MSKFEELKINIDAESVGNAIELTRYMLDQIFELYTDVQQVDVKLFQDRKVYFIPSTARVHTFEEYINLKDKYKVKRDKFKEENSRWPDVIEDAKKVALKHFGGNTKRLKRELEAEILLFVFALSHDTDDNSVIRDFIEIIFQPRLEILKSTYQAGFQEIHSFINEALMNKDKLFDMLLKIRVNAEEDLPKRYIFGVKELEDIYFTEEYGVNNYDREIYHVISSLYYAGHDYITPQMIYQVLRGGEKVGVIGENTREEILKSVRRLNNVPIEIPLRKAPVVNGIVFLDRSIREFLTFSMLPCVIMDNRKLNINGKEVNHCVVLLEEPPLCYMLDHEHMRVGKASLEAVFHERSIQDKTAKAYAIDNLNVVTGTVDIEMLNTPLEITQENVVLKCFLLREIAVAKKLKKKELMIPYSTLYIYLGIGKSKDDSTEQERHALNVKRSDIRDKVKKCLEFWREKSLIRRFECNSKR